LEVKGDHAEYVTVRDIKEFKMNRYTDQDLDNLILQIHNDINYESDRRLSKATANSNLIIIELLMRLLDK
jgi:hypothetical protein